MGSQGTEAELDEGAEARREGLRGAGRREQAGGRRAQTRGDVPRVLVEDIAQAGKGRGRGGVCTVVLVSRKLTALSWDATHVLRTDTWQL